MFTDEAAKVKTVADTILAGDGQGGRRVSWPVQDIADSTAFRRRTGRLRHTTKAIIGAVLSELYHFRGGAGRGRDAVVMTSSEGSFRCRSTVDVDAADCRQRRRRRSQSSHGRQCLTVAAPHSGRGRNDAAGQCHLSVHHSLRTTRTDPQHHLARRTIAPTASVWLRAGSRAPADCS